MRQRVQQLQRSMGDSKIKIQKSLQHPKMNLQLSTTKEKPRSMLKGLLNDSSMVVLDYNTELNPQLQGGQGEQARNHQK